MNRAILIRTILFVYFILLATIFDLFTVDNVNFLFISFALLGMILLTFLSLHDFPVSANYLLVTILGFMMFNWIYNFLTVRWTSLFYSVFFVGTFIFYSPQLQRFLKKEHFRQVLKLVFYLYFIGLIAGQLHVYFNLFSVVSGVAGFMKGSFGTIIEKDGMRYFSLSSEPSYAAFIVISVYYTYLKLQPGKASLIQGENFVMLALLLYMLVMFNSAYGILLFGIMLIDYVGLTWRKMLVGALALIALAILLVNNYEIRALTRVMSVLQRVDFTHPRGLFAIDFTAYYRVAPILHYLEILDLFNWDFLIGYGAGASRFFVVPDIYSAYQRGEFLGGFLPSFFYDYGIIGGGLVLVFLTKGVHRFISFQSASLLLMLLNANFNTQLFWLIFMCFYMLEFYRQEDSEEGEKPYLANVNIGK